jgi:hypothetical protein
VLEDIVGHPWFGFTVQEWPKTHQSPVITGVQEWCKMEQWPRMTFVQQRPRWCSCTTSLGCRCTLKSTPFRSYA